MTRRDAAPLQLTLVASTCALLTLLPFVTTFNDFLTGVAQWLGAVTPLQSVVPIEARMVVQLLDVVGVNASASGSNLSVIGSQGPVALYISWNCIGWQSLLLLGISFTTGLRRGQGLEAKVQVVLIGVLGTFLLNLLRVAGVCYLAATEGQTPAILFHDYGGTIITVVWLFAFWAFVFRWILVEPATQELEAA